MDQESREYFMAAYPAGPCWKSGVAEWWPRLLQKTQGKSDRLERALIYASLMDPESGGNPRAQGDYNRSMGYYEAFGFYQVHARGFGAKLFAQVGRDRAIELLWDPEYHLDFCLPTIDLWFDRFFSQGIHGGELAYWVGKEFERPYDDPNDPNDGPAHYRKAYVKMVGCVEWHS